MEKNPEIQFRSPEDIKSYQEEQLAKALAYLQAHSKFYQQMFAEHHIDINQIKTIEDRSPSLPRRTCNSITMISSA